MKKTYIPTVLTVLIFFFSTGLVSASSDVIKPCSFITQEQVSEIFGAPVKEPTEKLVTGLAACHKCMYYTDGEVEASGAMGSLIIELYDAQTMDEQGGTFKTPEDFFNFTMKNSRQIDMVLEEIPDLGQEAVWMPQTYQMNVLIPDYYITLKIGGIKKFTGDNKEEQRAAFRKEKCIELMETYILPKLQ
jgi:hypothetical protein